jgi:hypothetical protein
MASCQYCQYFSQYRFFVSFSFLSLHCDSFLYSFYRFEHICLSVCLSVCLSFGLSLPDCMSACMNGKLVKLPKDFNNLTGSIPSELAAVQTLERISMTGNFLFETIPSEMGNMPRLSWLNLGDNYLTGTCLKY